MSTSTFLQPLTTPFPPEMCAGTWFGVLVHAGLHAQIISLWAGDQVTPSLEPTVFRSLCPCSGTGMVQSSVWGEFGSGFICAPPAWTPHLSPLTSRGVSQQMKL